MRKLQINKKCVLNYRALSTIEKVLDMYTIMALLFDESGRKAIVKQIGFWQREFRFRK